MQAKKKILVDLTMLSDPFCGLGQVSIHFKDAIINSGHSEFNWVFLAPYGSCPEQAGLEFQVIRTNFLRKFFPYIPGGVDLWHSTYQHAKYPPTPKTPYVLTIHDLNFLEDPHEKHKNIKYLKLKKKIKHADAIVFVSNYTRTVAENNLNFKPGTIMKVINNGIKVKGIDQMSRPSFLKNAKYFFSIGELKWKKNFEAVIELMPFFNDFHLIIAGKHEPVYLNYLFNLIKELKLENRVFLPGIISEDVKNYLFHHCEAFIFPSKFEGFGLPVLEAFLHQKPVFIYNYSSLPEIAKNHAFYLENLPSNNRSELIKKGLFEFHQNPALGKEQLSYAESFTWEKNLEEYVKIYRDILQ